MSARGPLSTRGPLFLAGTDRSGIGLLGELLEEHPEIAVTRRINFWSFYYNRYGDLADPANLDRCLADMMRYTRIKRLQPQPERLRADFQDGEMTYARLFALLQEQNQRRLGKSRWADKSLNAERYADTILAAYPTARMVHIIRDPRDRYVSQATHRGAKKGKIGGGASLWLWSARLAERNQRQHPDRYKVVRYEDLVSAPEDFLQELCIFVDEPYSPEMLRVDQETNSPDEPAARAPREIWTTSVGRYRGALSDREVAFMQMVAGQLMAHYGYQPEALLLSGSARLTFYVKDIPLNLARLLISRSQAGIKERVGRMPSARRLALAS
ncbi:MAG: sulfotransferase [Chloroflexota bacterium]|nr:MAG: sulfotransferase [Chloroflexota bacterium]